VGALLLGPPTAWLTPVPQAPLRLRLVVTHLSWPPGTSTCIGGVTAGCIAPATVDATSVVGSPVRVVIDSGIAAIIGCSATSKGAL